VKHFTHGREVEGGDELVSAVGALLEGDPVCAAIVGYLVENERAADTAQGIAGWWIGRDVRATVAALETLAAHGVVQPHPVQQSSVYTFTKDPRLRAAIRLCLENCPRA